MNKYEELLIFLKGGNMFGDLSNENLELAEELIDKEKPMKPIDVKPPLRIYFACGKCMGMFIERVFTHCPYCGQKLDWGEIDE